MKILSNSLNLLLSIVTEEPTVILIEILILIVKGSLKEDQSPVIDKPHFLIYLFVYSKIK